MCSIDPIAIGVLISNLAGICLLWVIATCQVCAGRGKSTVLREMCLRRNKKGMGYIEVSCPRSLSALDALYLHADQ